MTTYTRKTYYRWELPVGDSSNDCPHKHRTPTAALKCLHGYDRYYRDNARIVAMEHEAGDTFSYARRLTDDEEF